ncbi:hypothetical protein L195_g016734 [Trifolium pratense]|uniref:Uncharacterized protein n=1 Tax=Trifolium pratense TaxID=57577 RepID=A0A2K3MS90_TRIPR|nr:hypothetical protein L195_g016734 [Trifolium pratense]
MNIVPNWDKGPSACWTGYHKGKTQSSRFDELRVKLTHPKWTKARKFRLRWKASSRPQFIKQNMDGPEQKMAEELYPIIANKLVD